MTRLCLLLFWFACGGPSDDATTAPPPTTGDTGPQPIESSASDVLDAWATLSARLQESPDHREARAAALIEAGNAEAIIDFVRDEIGVLPLNELDSTTRQDRHGWFGARGTLRGGVGTLRDQTELLAWMLTEAGFEAVVRSGTPETGFDDPALTVRPGGRPAFAPPITEGDRADWARLFGAPPTLGAPIDPATPAEDLRSTIAERTPDGPGLELQTEIDVLPVVVFQRNGEEVFVTPGFPDAGIGEDTVGVAIDPRDLIAPEIEVRVWARRTDGTEVDWVSGTWTSADLTGRRLTFRSRPVLDFVDALGTPVGDVAMFLPTLSVEDPGADPDVLATLNVVGSPITVTGHRVTFDPDTGAVNVDGRALAATDDDPAQIAQVASIEVEANATTFPDVRLAVAPRDASGALVPGLSGGVWEVRDEGILVSAVQQRNTFVPRVVTLVDQSGSMPDEWRGAAWLPFAEDFANAVLAFPGAEITAQSVQDRIIRTEFVTTPAEFVDQVEDISFSSSTLWGAIELALARQPDLVVLISDANPTDELTPTIEAALASTQARILALVVADPPDNSFVDALDAFERARVVDVADYASALAEIGADLQPDASIPLYTLSYRAPADTPSLRTVEVALRDTNPRATTTYEVPTNPVVGRGWASLHLTITMDDRGSVTRTLAGLEPEVDTATADRAVLDQVVAALHGTASLVVEGGPPGLSEVLDDEVRTRLALRTWRDALDQTAAFTEAVDTSGYAAANLAPQWLLGDFANDGRAGWTTPIGPRFVLHLERPGYTPGDAIRRVDVLPLTRWTTYDAAPGTTFATTMARTLQLAVLEAALYEDNSLTRLTGETLIAVNPEALPAPFEGDPAWEALARDLDDEWQLLVPADAEPVAAWAVHLTSGTTLGLLPGGAGGGQSAAESVARTERMLDAISQLYGLTGLGGGAWIELEIAKAKIVNYATLAIANLGGGLPGGDTPEDILIDFLCGQAEGTITDQLPQPVRDALEAYGEIAGPLDLPPASLCG